MLTADMWQANAGDFIYIFYGTLDKPTDLPPKGEFFCKYRDGWMPEVPGKYRSLFPICPHLCYKVSFDKYGSYYAV
jgi:hypothetical protein